MALEVSLEASLFDPLSAVLLESEVELVGVLSAELALSVPVDVVPLDVGVEAALESAVGVVLLLLESSVEDVLPVVLVPLV